MHFTRLAWLGGLLSLALGEPQGYGYGYGGYSFPGLKSAGTVTSPPTLSTGVSGTAPGNSLSPTSALYGNSSSSFHFHSGTAPFSTGISSLNADPNTTAISGSPTPPANATSYGTVSGAPYTTSNSSVSGYPTYSPTHGPYPLPSSLSPFTSYPSGTIGTAVSTKVSGNTTTIASTGDPLAKRTLASTGDPSAKKTTARGTAASTGLASAPSSFGTSGKLTYTAPTGIPSEYYYHHKKSKRNVSRSPLLQRPNEMRDVLMEVTQAPYGGGLKAHLAALDDA
ncbi:MAG: hypothetical protein ALECFALPRED_001750 [Alectoria fallacina]|uniref:Uncharacterized protein n=1 Tax=Alectoria fallacina TaxID=1903189 RepID=A0A8H3FI07_9LECA|nr:MAG: hypothetical protein ALECFALPRED_001750 [Alectoria fallacina]